MSALQSVNNALHGDEQCFHCGVDLSPGASVAVVVDGARHSVCSARCAEVCHAIDGAGLARFYRRRRARHAPATLATDVLDNLAVYDHATLQRRFVRRADGFARATLLLEGLRCGACAHLVETRVNTLEGVESILVNATTHRAQLRYNPARINLSEVLAAIYALGYAAYPYAPDRRRELLATERRELMLRLAIGALCSMQIMMLSFALYAGDWFGIEPGVRRFFVHAQLLLALPVVAYSAWPFFDGALRALNNRGLTMDVPVAVALAIAFAASVAGTVAGNGEVYYESIAMFTTLLLASRYFELRARRDAGAAFDRIARITPQFANRLDATGRAASVAVGDLSPGDVILVRPGARIPVDGTIVEGDSELDEAVVSGESRARPKSRGDAVVGGSINLVSPLKVEVTRRVEDSFVEEIGRIAQSAYAWKPRLAVLADRIAGRFVAAVLAIAAGVALYWWYTEPEMAVGATIAVLVISCPCALALATPAALTAASAAMLKHGAAMRNATVIEALGRATTFIFDKTGTLTTGKLELERIRCAGIGEREALVIAAALGEQSGHSIARSLVRAAGDAASVPARNVCNVPGEGLFGEVAGERYWLGSRTFIASRTGHKTSELFAAGKASAKRAFLARRDGILAGFWLRDELRPGACEFVRTLQRDGRRVAMFSGDDAEPARAVAAALGIEDVEAGVRPQEKLAALAARQRQDEVAVVVGDGVNDAPMLAGAYTSVAVAGACDLAQQHADLIILEEDLGALADACRLSRRTLRIVRQNVIWAISYNACAVPLAAAGYAPPWVAALGMSLSSLVVVLNAARVAR